MTAVTRTTGTIVIIGIGNPDRGDDGAGRAVAARLAGSLSSGIRVAEHGGEATGLLALVDGVDAVYFVDACASGGSPGTVHRFDAAAARLPATVGGVSSHGFGLGEAVELARTLGMLPPRAIVYAIEGANFETGAPLSTPVAAAAADVAARLRSEVAAMEPSDA